MIFSRNYLKRAGLQGLHHISKSLIFIFYHRILSLKEEPDTENTWEEMREALVKHLHMLMLRFTLSDSQAIQLQKMPLK